MIEGYIIISLFFFFHVFGFPFVVFVVFWMVIESNTLFGLEYINMRMEKDKKEGGGILNVFLSLVQKR